MNYRIYGKSQMLVNLYKKNINTQYNLKSKGTPAKPLLPNCDTVSFGNSKPTSYKAFESLSPIYEAALNYKIPTKEEEEALLIEYHANCEPFRIVTRHQETLQGIKEIGVPSETETRKIAKLKKLQAILAQLETELPATETPEAKEKIKRAEKALKKLIEYNMQFVYAEAAKIYQKRNLKCLDINDLMAYGIKYLIKAIDMFDLEQNDNRLYTYATPAIERGIFREINLNETLIRIPLGQEGEKYRIDGYNLTLSQKLGRAPSVREIAMEILKNELQETKKGLNQQDYNDKLDCLMKRILIIKKAFLPVKSIHENIGDYQDSFALPDFIPDESIESPVDYLNKKSINEFINSRKELITNLLKKKLKPREREYIELKFGLIDNVPKNEAEVVKLMKLSRQRVKIIKKQALKKLYYLFSKTEFKELFEYKTQSG